MLLKFFISLMVYVVDLNLNQFFFYFNSYKATNSVLLREAI